MVPRQLINAVHRCSWLPAISLALLSTGCTVPAEKIAPEQEFVVISVVGTNDVHGELSAASQRGGLTTLSGYVDALRSVRSRSNGGVLLIDAGDMWQGTLDSNLSEGASVVEAFNALRYDAVAIGNHEFDFGPAGPAAIPESDADDAQGALRLRATEANFPLLAANLIDTTTGSPVDWQNVQPSTMLDVSGIKIGVIGVMTENALTATIAANTVGLKVASLTDSISREASRLRERGAQLVIVTAHAGSVCTEFVDPLDLSSCNLNGEITRVASELPPGLVDHINAGHVHQGMAHIVNGIAITSSYSSTRAFSRVDFTVDRGTGEVQKRRVFAPRQLCGFINTQSGDCASADGPLDSVVVARYEGLPVIPNSSVVAIATRAAAEVNEKKEETLGVSLVDPITRDGGPEAAISHLMTDAVLQQNDADISIHNVVGGIRADLPAGDLTFGSVFNMFPFDNRIVILDLSGAEVRRIIASQAHRNRRRPGFSGMQVFVGCDDNSMDIKMTLTNGRDIQDRDRVRVVVNDYLAFGGDGVLTPVIPEDGLEIDTNMPLVRDVLVDWFTTNGGQLRASDFLNLGEMRWNLPDPFPAECAF